MKHVSDVISGIIASVASVILAQNGYKLIEMVDDDHDHAVVIDRNGKTCTVSIGEVLEKILKKEVQNYDRNKK